MRCDAMPPSLVHHILFASCRRGPGFVGYWTGIHSWHGACQPYNATRICILPPVSKVHPLFKLLPILGFRSYVRGGHADVHFTEASSAVIHPGLLSSALLCCRVHGFSNSDHHGDNPTAPDSSYLLSTSSPPPSIYTDTTRDYEAIKTHVRTVYAERETDSNRTRT